MAASAAVVFAGKSVAAPAISFVVTKAFSYLSQFRGAQGMEDLRARLLLAIPKIQAVFDIIDPERIREQSGALDSWLWQLRDAIEEAEDAIDELEYHELEERAMDRKVSDWGSPFAKMKHKTIRRIKNIGILDKTVKSITRHDTLRNLMKAVDDLDRAAAGFVNFLELAERLKGCTRQQEEYPLNRDRDTGSILTATKVFGRQKEKELVIEWLTKASDQDAETGVSSNHVSVVSVVGHGGMGKTTLAQLICKDDSITKHFEQVIWVCVSSTSFNATTVISKVLESATWETPAANTLDALQKMLREKLKSVKFLLILDDVWEDEKNDPWEKLFAPLRTGKSGSKILITTRMKSVADLATYTMGGETECLALQGLEDCDNIMLFNHHAFCSAGLQDYAALGPVGEQIAKNVRGCPLVTKVVAAHLRGNMTFQYWNNFLRRSLQHFEGNAENIMNVLKISYYHLPVELQTCFRYCSIYPQDYEFSKIELLEMWMGSGLILQEACGTRRLHDIGEEYLVQLTRKSFFDLRFTYDNLGRIYEESGHYVMHDLMHDLATFVSFGECAQINDTAKIENVASTVRHIRFDDIGRFPVEKIRKISLLKCLRTIIIDGHPDINKDALNAVEELVQGSKSLRLFQTELPHTSVFAGKLAKLKHLRFIQLLKISPESIRGIMKLYHLRFLDCRDVEIKQKQLREVGNLNGLQYIKYGVNGFGNFPVGRLLSLQVLEDYWVDGSCPISALKDLRSLRTLGVQGLENVDNHEEAKEAELKEKQYLESLSLIWSECDDARSRSDELILENLEPHANLKQLYISHYSGTRIPNWIGELSVKNLVRLEFRSCRNCEELPILRELLTLKHLTLQDLPRLKNLAQPLTAIENEGVKLFLPPKLCTLVIRCCSELRKLPPVPPSLLLLETVEVGLTSFPRIRNELCSKMAESESSQLMDIRVVTCPRLTSLVGSLLEQKEWMKVLRVLRISNCVHLESASIPFEEMNELIEIDIKDCPKLRALRNAGGKFLPSSLKSLAMENCGDLDLPLLGSLQGLTNLKSLEMRNCSSVISLPSADMFTCLKSLQRVSVSGCDNLSSLGGLGSLPRLSSLHITSCCRLAEAGSSLMLDTSGGKEDHLIMSSNSMQIEELYIDLPSLLLTEPLKSFCHTKKLSIGEGSEMESLPEQWLVQNLSSLRSVVINKAKSLESLPSCMRDLSSLKTISLCDAAQLCSLPELPSSLQMLYVGGCHSELLKKVGQHGSLERCKISHVPRARIGELCFTMGKECSRDTYDHLCYKEERRAYFLRELARRGS